MPTHAAEAGQWAASVKEEVRALTAIAVPLGITFMAEVAMGFTDTIVVAQLGATHLAAIGLGANVLFGFLFVCLGFVTLVTVLVPEADAAGDEARAGLAARQGLWVAVLVSVPATWIGWNLAPILRFLGQEESVVLLTEQWMRAAVWSFLPYMWFTALRHFLAGVGRAKVVTVVAIAAVGVNAGANYVLVFGELGFPRLGIAGSGYASTIVCWAMFAGTLAYGCLAGRVRRFSLLAGPWIDLAVCRQMIRLGVSFAGFSAAEMSLFIAVTLLMGVIGEAGRAAHPIV
jgi:MATE family multidrug resistance protein